MVYSVKTLLKSKLILVLGLFLLSSCGSDDPVYIPSGGGGGYGNNQGFYDDNDYPYYEDNDSYYYNSNKYPTYDPNADNSNYYYENYDKRLPQGGSNIDNTYPIYFD